MEKNKTPEPVETNRFLKNLWRWKCGMEEVECTAETVTYNVKDLQKSEWSTEFEKLMRNRLVFGAYRYGKMGHGSIPPGKPEYDRAASIRARLERFEATGNAEWLVDIANMALLMYEERVHPNFNFTHVDGDAEDSYHDKVVQHGGAHQPTIDNTTEPPRK